jgi:pimeloyl-ACP methyl ester carboxylesterase
LPEVLAMDMNPAFRLRVSLLGLIASCTLAAQAQRFSQLTTPTPLPPGSTLVIGFLGGYDRWDDPHRSVRQLVLKLRQTPGVYAESISNHHRALALQLIREALDTNRNGKLDLDERPNARLILFGQSWGGAAAISTARDLQKLDIPVLLTIQIDSVGVRDGIVPSNVRAAVNFYQHDPFTTIHGRARIRAADPSHTAILGNFESSYVFRTVDQSNASRARQVFGGSHTKMELDPVVWNRVEQYISDAIARRLP